MKRLLFIGVICCCFGYTLGEAQDWAQRYTQFADTGKIACVSWNVSPTTAGKFDVAKFYHQGTKHAWVYGFVAGAAYMSEQGLARIDAATADVWIDQFCRRYPQATVANAVAALADDLANRR